ncbi:MAG TPA: lysylphosphatidylglycerol synthase transmembrane domain-containing protein [Gaiellaceae bacterium]|nr:lysylphosphatidylglycerol synthase transmembrane domain-containing protein [Gaiellaceae bacterium]
MNLSPLLDAVDSAASQFGALDARFLLPALGLQLLVLALRALAWRGVLAAAYPGRRIPFLSVGAAYVTGVALNAFTPARGGELAKIAIVRARVAGTTVPTIVASLGVLVALDVLVGAGLLAAVWATGGLPVLPSLPGTAVVVVGAVALVATGIGSGLAYRLRPAFVRDVLGRVAQGFAILRTPGRYLVTVLPFQMGAWAARIGVVFLVLSAFDIEATLPMAALVVVLNGAATATPVPGGAGTQQVLATYALHGAVSVATAVSFSVGLQLGVTVVNTLVGLTALMVLFRTVRPLAVASSTRALVARSRPRAGDDI